MDHPPPNNQEAPDMTSKPAPRRGRLRPILYISLIVIAVAGAAVYLLWRDHQAMLQRALMKYPGALEKLPESSAPEPPAERFRKACAVLAKEMKVPVETLESSLPVLARKIDEEKKYDWDDEGRRLFAGLIVVHLSPEPDSLETLKRRESLALSLYENGTEYGGLGEIEMREVVARRLLVQGPDHEDTLRARTSLAFLLFKQEHYPQAETEALTLLSARERLKGPEDATTQPARRLLAMILHSAKKFTEEELLRRSLLATAERLKKTGDWETMLCRYDLAACLHAQAKDEEALPLVKQALEMSRAKKGNDTFTVKCLVLLNKMKVPP